MPDQELMNQTDIVTVNQTEIDMQISTAKAYPRDLGTFVDRCKVIATRNEEVAGSCLYTLRKGGKMIQGPSVRLAEICASQYGNARIEARPKEEAARHVTAEAVFWDLETNLAVKTEVRRSIWGKKGRYSDDLIAMVVNAACAVARRNATIQGIPRALLDEVYEAARTHFLGDAKTLEQTREHALQTFRNLGISDEQICATLGVESTDQIREDEISQLRGIRTAVKDEGEPVEKFFVDPDQVEEEEPDLPPVKGNEGVRGKLDAGKKKAEPEPDAQDPESSSAKGSRTRRVNALAKDLLPEEHREKPEVQKGIIRTFMACAKVNKIGWAACTATEQEKTLERMQELDAQSIATEFVEGFGS